MFDSRRASRRHAEGGTLEQLLGVLPDKAENLHNDRTFHSKESYDFCFVFILTVFGGKMMSQCLRQIFIFFLQHKK